MRLPKQTILVTVCAMAIVAAGYSVMRTLQKNRGAPPKWYDEKPLELVDSETFELTTLTYGEWQDLGQKNGAYMNPHTGKYTMVKPMECSQCGSKIPTPPIPGRLVGTDKTEYRKKVERILSDYKCPRCGHSPLPNMD